MLAMPHLEDGAIDTQELLRRLAEQVVNAIMDAEADQLCAGGANSCNGCRKRELKTCMGDITLLIPKLVFSQRGLYPRGHELTGSSLDSDDSCFITAFNFSQYIQLQFHSVIR